MDLVLAGITVISLALTIGMGIVLFRASKQERLRADARVAVLAQAAAQTEARLATRNAQQPDTILGADAASAPDLFAAHDAPSPWGRRLMIAGTAAVAIATVGVGLAAIDWGISARGGAARSAPAATLELRALDHVRNLDSIVVSGVVHNPRTGGTVSNVAATALVFDAGGTLLATGVAGLDYTRLGPGEESPFVIKVPVSGQVSRYRVGFRRADGAVLPHVDVRGGSSRGRFDSGGGNAIASSAALPGSVPWVR